MDQIQLNNGSQIPQIGIGTWKITEPETLKKILCAAYDIGYRLVDTAAVYGNEVALGKAVRELGMPRSRLFIMDKVWTTYMGYDKVKQACKKSLRKLKMDYLDIYLIHWPASPRLHPDWKKINADTWRGMESLVEEGFVRMIGLSNFKKHHMEELKNTARIKPVVNQVEFHPGLIREEIVNYCKKEHIRIQASSPLGNGQILGNEVLLNIARTHHRPVSQICLRWTLEKGVMVLPKTSRITRLKENWDVFDFELSASEIEMIDRLPFCGGFNIDADEVTEFG